MENDPKPRIADREIFEDEEDDHALFEDESELEHAGFFDDDDAGCDARLDDEAFNDG